MSKSLGLTKEDSLSLKGVAILIMLFHHLYYSVSVFENHYVDFSPFSQDTVVSVALFFKICVSIFAFITGYGLLKSISTIEFNRKNVFKWNITRLIKTMSGFWFIYILSFIITMIIDQRPLKVYFGGSRIKGILYMLLDFLGLGNFFGTPKLNGTWWYMSAAIIFILIIPFIYLSAKKFSYLPVALIIAALPRLLNIGYPGEINAYSFILPVIFGMLFAQYNLFEKISGILPKNKIISYIACFIVFGFLTVACYFLYRVYPQNKGWEFNFAVVPAIVILFLRYCIIRIPVIKQILCFFGKHSLTMFLTHTFIKSLYLNDFTYSFENFILIYVVFVATSTVLAIAIDLFISAIKYRSFVDKAIIKINKAIDNLNF